MGHRQREYTLSLRMEKLVSTLGVIREKVERSRDSR
jgi:hypothetical protein